MCVLNHTNDKITSLIVIEILSVDAGNACIHVHARLHACTSHTRTHKDAHKVKKQTLHAIFVAGCCFHVHTYPVKLRLHAYTVAMSPVYTELVPVEEGGGGCPGLRKDWASIMDDDLPKRDVTNFNLLH